MENNPEKIPERSPENIEQQPIIPENEKIAPENIEEIKEMSLQDKEKALEDLKSELAKEYDHVGPNVEWGANDVKPESAIVKKERPRDVEIQSRDEFLEQHLEAYMDQNFPKESQEEKGALNEFIEEEGDVSREKREEFLNEYLEKYSKEKFGNAKRIEALKEEYGEEWINEFRKEFDAEKFKNESAETKEKIKEFDEKYSTESKERIDDSVQEELGKNKINPEKIEGKAKNNLALETLGWLGAKTTEFVLSLPARWYDATVFLYNLAEAILDGKVQSFIDKEIKNRANKKKAQMEKVFYGE